MHLKPRGDRQHVDQVIQELRRKFATVPGINAYLQNPPLIRTGGMLSKSLYQFTLQGPDSRSSIIGRPSSRSEWQLSTAFRT